jgi:hypothetical protein
MGEVVYVSKSRIERKQGSLRVAHLPGEAQPVIFSVSRRYRRALQGGPVEIDGVALFNDRLCDFSNRWLNDGNLRRCAGSPPN